MLSVSHLSGQRFWNDWAPSVALVSQGTGDWRLMKASAQRSFISRASELLAEDTLVSDSLENVERKDDKAAAEQQSPPN